METFQKKTDVNDDWLVDSKHRKATHKSGITFTLVDRAEDGDIMIKFSAPKNWVSQQKKENPQEDIEDILQKLKKEFKNLMKDIPLKKETSELVNIAFDKYRQKVKS